MRYISTRGGTPSVDFEGALFSGYASDGGLFMPEEIPQLDRETLKQWSTLSYPALVMELCSLFIDPELIPKKDLKGLIGRAFSRFRHRDVVHLSRLKNGLNVLELWHGITYAFKDLSLSCSGQFLQYFLEKRQKHVTIVVGTSGDTGSSAIESVRGAKNIDIIVLLPLGLCSKIQELQMTTVIEDNVHVFGVEGNSDELDEPIRAVFADVAFAKKHNLMSLNSINWSRILVQMAHYFFAYFQCVPSMDVCPLPPVEVVVPTGAAGNLAAGCIAQEMGLPVRLATVVNHNDIIHRAVRQGDFSLSGNTRASLASAMDIQVPYNMERIFWLLSGADSKLVRALMEQFDRTQKLRLPQALHTKISETIDSLSASDEDIIQTMRRCWEENHYLLCPHSAVAAFYHYKRSASEQPSLTRCCLAPASAVKFQDAILQAQLVPEIPEDIQALEHMPTRSNTLCRGDDWTQVLRDKIEDLSQQRRSGGSSQE
ncbi:threonine synthase-like 2 isoform X1 [Monodelphis domestica]|uniref:threonine synthase-like 2 isoform X1 n=1 Tax=Monodelphis domestica TaxID=13616 RepID=UPI0024E25E83|nr:threonine synthase-like 2 isoform X1 [Monodelphis domestica]XP_056669112.1 threonine synthase-like 2 isoform X1 [Monodelphis domestica]